MSTSPEDNVVPLMTKIGRNDPCPCGSGKKYKQCCAAPRAGDPSGQAQATAAEVLQIAIDHHHAGRLPLAATLYRQILEADPYQPDALYLSGMLARQRGELELAADFFGRTLQVHPGHAGAAISLGNVQQSLGRLDAAGEIFRTAIRANPKSFEAHANLGTVLQAQGRLDDALASYRAALAINSVSAEVLGNLGNVLQGQGLFDEAVENYRKALALFPDSAELLSNLGVSLQARGSLDEAVASMQRALSLKPDYAAAHYNLGLAREAQGNAEAAAECYRAALRILPGNAQFQVKLAAILHAQGRTADAVAAYRQAIALNPASVAAHNGLDTVLSSAVPLWHVPMMNDALRNDAYLQALKAAVTPDTNVLEIGTGSGLLSMMAAKLGAKSVLTCEAEPIIAAAARRVIADNGLDQRIEVIAKFSNDLRIGADLPQPADILVSEILSSELLAERVLPSIEDARRRLLKPGGRMIPAAGSIMIALFGGEAIGSNVLVEDSCGFNLRHFNTIVQKKQGITRNDLSITMLTDAVEALHFDFQNEAYHAGEAKLLRIPVKTDGRCYGIIQWIRLQMDQHTVFENHPQVKAAASGWQHLAYIFAAPLELKAGQVARVAAAHNRIIPWFSFEGTE